MGIFSKGSFFDQTFGTIVDVVKGNVEEIFEAERRAGVERGRDILSDREARNRIDQIRSEQLENRRDIGFTERVAIGTGNVTFRTILIVGVAVWGVSRLTKRGG